MLKSLSFTTNGELTGIFGVKNIPSYGAINLSTYDKMDEINMLATQLRCQFILDVVDLSQIFFTNFEANENNMLSMLAYSPTGILALGNMEKATAKEKVVGALGGLRFITPIDGHLVTLHAMLRLCLIKNPPNETILGHFYSLFINLLYQVTVRLFDKAFGISNLSEKYFAAIKYACACVVASKHFNIDGNINNVAIPITAMTYKRVSPDLYRTENNIKTYEDYVTYLNEYGITKDLDKMTFINTLLRSFGYRILIDLECGMDMLIDIMLCKATSIILPRNIIKYIIPSQLETIMKLIRQYYIMQSSTGPESWI